MIGIITIATGRYYDQYVPELVRSLETHFLPQHEREIFVLTDRKETGENFRLLPIEHKPWPMDTLLRFAWITKYAKEFSACSHLFYLDADMVVVDTVDEEVLADGIVATRHPGFYPDKVGTFERNPASLACVPREHRGHYFQGCFFGGSREAFLAMARELDLRVQDDLSRDLIALWWDESHLNWYLAQHPPAKALLPSYAYVLPWNLPVPKKIVHLVKDHASMRS